MATAEALLRCDLEEFELDKLTDFSVDKPAGRIARCRAVTLSNVYIGLMDSLSLLHSHRLGEPAAAVHPDCATLVARLFLAHVSLRAVDKSALAVPGAKGKGKGKGTGGGDDAAAVVKSFVYGTPLMLLPHTVLQLLCCACDGMAAVDAAGDTDVASLPLQVQIFACLPFRQFVLDYCAKLMENVTAMLKQQSTHDMLAAAGNSPANFPASVASGASMLRGHPRDVLVPFVVAALGLVLKLADSCLYVGVGC